MSEVTIKKIVEIPNEGNNEHPDFKTISPKLCSGNGYIYLQGGSLRKIQTDQFIENLWQFDISNLIWRKLGNLENFKLGREHHTITFDNEVIYVIGGTNKNNPDGISGIDKINVNTFEVTHFDSPSLSKRSFHTSVIKSSKIYIIGGLIPIEGKTKGVPCDSFIIYDTKTDDIKIQKLPFGGIAQHTSFIDDNGLIYIIGGKGDNNVSNKNIYIYDIYKSKWETIPSPINLELLNLQSVFVESKKIAVLVGGRLGAYKRNSSIYILNTKTKSLYKKDNGIEFVAPDCGICLLKDSIFAFGSFDKNISVLSFDEFFSINSLVNSSTRVIVNGVSCVSVEVGEKPKLDEKVQKTLEISKCDYDEISKILLENGFNTDDTFCLLDQPICEELKIDPIVSAELISKRSDVYDENNKFGEDALKNFNYLTECEVGEKLGNGAFGVVCKGMWLGTTPVAMKAIDGALDKPEKLQEIIKEAYVTQLMKHPNVITMYGLYKNEESLFMVIDLAEGCLLDYVQNKGGKYPESKRMIFKDYVRCAMDVASGMAYLESQKIVHRDLALRNVLYIHDKLGIRGKVADLGLSRKSETGEYAAKSTAKTMPIRWTAPEAAARGIFTIKNDVWAYGITLWELFTKGKLPYSALNKEDVIPSVNAGTRLEKPDYLKHPIQTINRSACEEEVSEDDGYGETQEELSKSTKIEESDDEIGNDIWEMMYRCWDIEPQKRPTFKEIYKILEKVMEKIPNEQVEQEVKEESEEDNGYE
ncbi:tyrosine protein kinase, putative [Entamoeba dispar SAW760]|uniref:Tyrosine protein kinase, putative n=1 Tax=Entamoeba dispar (strain ATCC PRA-260 / SAW760) TaxID=370354 RepID=B0ESC8_ENTDS|nr:tyrosine protein kinase, putative [Entamoeba dispar SAW760]EDR22552.1 tyrosine protein kinase, putative [Entamoeba dispar SAW760]|eukprot:EDR22552.1 tyrosine protein kinase, putative [Entamoeba dispar SAW760]